MDKTLDMYLRGVLSAIEGIESGMTAKTLREHYAQIYPEEWAKVTKQKLKFPSRKR